MPYTTPVIIDNPNIEYNIEYNSDKNGDLISDLRAKQTDQEYYNEDDSSVKSVQNFENTHTLKSFSILEIPNELQDKIDEINKYTK